MSVLKKIHATLDTMAPADRQIGQFIVDNPDEMLQLSSAALAEQTGRSQSSVVKFSQKLGYASYQQLKLAVSEAKARQWHAPAGMVHGSIERGDGYMTVLQKLVASKLASMQQTMSINAEQTIGDVLDRLDKADRIHLAGVSAGVFTLDGLAKLDRDGTVFPIELSVGEAPTDEDRRWAPDIAGSDWLTTLDFAMRNFKDESFIQQFLSPKVIRDLKLFSVLDDDRDSRLRVTAIHNDSGYREIREMLAQQYNLSQLEPNIQVAHVDLHRARSLTLRHVQSDRRPLDEGFEEVLKHVARLWGFTVRLETVFEDGRSEMTHETKVEKRRRYALSA